MKTCKTCKIEKPLTDFYKRKDSKDGFYSQCKKCYSERVKNNKKEYKEKYLRISRERDELFRRLYGISYKNLHNQINRIKNKPEECQICNEIKELELSSINHRYTKNPKDYMYLCSSCHKLKDKISRS